MLLRQKLELCLLSGAVAASRFAFRSHDLYDLDSVNFALAMGRFDPHVHQPHPPGYFLYVIMGRLGNGLVHDPNLALVLVSILAGIATIVLIYLLALDWFGPRAATCAGLLFLFSPLAWFHGTVALTYSVEACASSLTGLLCWKILRGKTSLVLPAAIVLGIAAGVRPSSILFLGPLFLFSLRRAPAKQKIIGIAALCLTAAAWFLPMIQASGGFAVYFGALASLWRMVPSKSTVFNSSPVTSVARACMIVFIYFLCFGTASLAPLAAGFASQPGDKGRTGDRDKKIFTAVWIVPSLCFFTFIFLKLVNSGYLLLAAAPACVWLGAWTAAWYDGAPWPKPVKAGLIALCAAVNVLIFLDFPAYCAYRSVRHFEAELQQTQAAIPKLGTPQDLLIVAFDNHTLGFRHAGYYLPEYLTLEYPEATLVEGKRIFAMRGRDTFLLPQLPAPGCSRFVFFPLPDGDPEYVEYLEKVEERLPAADLRTVTLGGREFVTAPIADLKLLFPEAPVPSSANPAAAVYTPRANRAANP